MAYAMVARYGMSEKLGDVDYGANWETLSPETRMTIESEVKRLCNEGRERARKLLTERRHELDLLAKALVTYETLDKEEAFKVIEGKPLEGRLAMPLRGGIKKPEDQDQPKADLPPIPGSPEAHGEDKPPSPPTGLVEG